MPYQAETYNLMLASPGDVAEEKQIARELIYDWNNINSLARKIVLLPLSWDYNSIPTMGERPQAIINKQVLKNADILVGIFWTRIGTPTGKAISGTVEEIEEHIKSGKPAMLYFSNKPVAPESLDTEQYSAVKKLKAEFQANGLTNDFESSEDFRNQFQRHLAMKMNEDAYFSKLLEDKVNKIIGNSYTQEPLSEDAKKMLLEISKDGSGQLIRLGFIGGFTFETNGTQLNDDMSPRTKARWDAALNELLEAELLEAVGFKGEIFQITAKGYKIADTY